MHIAICDDNIADRKQLERLLSRESDRRISTTGGLYIDSYGHESTLLRAPMVYDLFFIDMTEEHHTGLDVAERLRDFGVTAPIVMCSKSINYEMIPHNLSTILHLQKPLYAEQLSALLSTILVDHCDKKPTIEIRDEENTFYIFPKDIIYAEEASHTITVYLTDGSTRKMLGSFLNFYAMLEVFPSFFKTSRNCILNTDHITSISLTKVIMTSNITIALFPWETRQLKNNFSK